VQLNQRGEGAQAGRHPAIRKDSSELLDRMALSDTWHVTAGPHKKGDLGSTTRDGTTHITVFIRNESYHLRMDKRGHLFQVTDKNHKPLGGVAPYASPGAVID
jgi:hypothetical protein